MKRIYYLLLTIFLLLILATVNSQVRVGGNMPPHPAAMLDLNPDTNNNAVRGLALSRVKLTSINSPVPLASHVMGMCVYNVTDTGDVKPGLYYNDGTKWIAAGSMNNLPGNIVDSIVHKATYYIMQNFTDSVMSKGIVDTVINYVVHKFSDSTIFQHTVDTVIVFVTQPVDKDFADSLSNYVHGRFGDSVLSYVINNFPEQLYDSIFNYVSENLDMSKGSDTLLQYLRENFSEEFGDTILKYVTNNFSQGLSDTLLNNLANNFPEQLYDSIFNYVINNLPKQSPDSLLNNILDNVNQTLTDSIMSNVNIGSADNTLVVQGSGTSDIDLGINFVSASDSLSNYIKGRLGESILNFITRNLDINNGNDALLEYLRENFSQEFGDVILRYITGNFPDQLYKNILNYVSENLNMSNGNDTLAQYLKDNFIEEFGDIILKYVTNNFPEQFSDSLVNNIINNVNQSLTDSIMSNVDIGSANTTLVVQGSGTSDIDLGINFVSASDSLSNYIHGRFGDSVLNYVSENLDISNAGDTLLQYLRENFSEEFGDTILQYVTNNFSQGLSDTILNNLANNFPEQLYDSILNYVINNLPKQSPDSLLNNILDNVNQTLTDSIMSNVDIGSANTTL
ncbi:MAG: hypothetical protein LBR45_04400, partial [Bacteroidales bacterium]|nr:hypothetical protein [Bacteroidales bacterium]